MPRQPLRYLVVTTTDYAPSGLYVAHPANVASTFTDYRPDARFYKTVAGASRMARKMACLHPGFIFRVILAGTAIGSPSWIVRFRSDATTDTPAL